jgi:succinyl-CoA synthetase alpha subunit
MGTTARADPRRVRSSTEEAEIRAKEPIWRVPLEELPGIQPTLFRELDHRIARTRLEHEPLPETFLSCEDGEGTGNLVFRGERYDLSITLFDARPAMRLPVPAQGSGVFVVSNGAGVATNTVDQLSSIVRIAGMIDLKQGFGEDKIAAAFEMIRSVRRDLDALVINMISGIAFARDTAAAVERFCDSVGEAVPVILRFTGPDPGDNEEILRALEQRHDCVTIVHSTRDLVEKTIELFALGPEARPRTAPTAEKLEAALSTRARLGVTLDPEVWLTPDRTLEHVLGSKETTRIGVLGFGRAARFQIGAMLEQGVRICWAATPSAAKHADPGIPDFEVFPSVQEAVVARGDVDIVLNYAPAGQVLEATRDCVGASPRAKLMILVAENVAYEKAIRAMDVLDENGMICIGPNSPGLMLVDERDGRTDLFKLGNMPGFLFETLGGMSVVGRSGTVVFDIVEKAAAGGIGTRFAWAIGGDRYTGFGFLESLVMLEQDSHTRFIVLNGESGGIQEQLAARLMATGIVSKPVIAMVVGEALPAGVQYGHQGSVKFAEADDPRVKKRHLAAAGVIVADSPTEVVEIVQAIDRDGWDLDARRRDALWEQLVAAGRVTGRRWHERMRATYDLLYDLVGHYRIFDAHERTPEHLHELATHLTAVGIERFSELLSTTIRPDAFRTAFRKSREYVAELARGIHEIGIENFKGLVERVFSHEAYNQALAATPWAAADLINEAHAIGIPETQTVVAKTMGTALFRDTLARHPWNTAHAFRSINNMRWWRYVQAYDRCCTHLAGDNQLPRASWRRDPWASVKLVRLYDRMPDDGFERAIETPDGWRLFVDKSREDPQGLLDIASASAREFSRSGRPFHLAFRDHVGQGVRDRPEVEAEIERMGREDFQELIDLVFTPDAFERSRKAHKNSTARALRTINDLGDEQGSGARKIIDTYLDRLEAFDTPAFRLAVERNLWMVVDLLIATARIDAISLQRIVDYVVSQADFNLAVAEHQWGISQAFRKIADMGPTTFLDTHRIIEDVTHDRESYGAGFKKNPRDTVEIVQVVAMLGKEGFARLMSDPGTREAFLTRIRVCPRNAAHFLQQVAEMGVDSFNGLVDVDFGRDVLNGMLVFKGCNLVHSLRRINIVGVEEFRRELRAWKMEDSAHVLTPENAIDAVGVIKERVLERRFFDPEREIPVTLRGQPTYHMSEGEIRGLYESYPEWGEVIFKLEGGQPMTHAERVDLYRLVSGRKRFQTHMVAILTNFLPLGVIRSRIDAGEPVIREIRALRGVSQRSPHRFDAYFHTLEVLDQLENAVLPLDFVPEPVRLRVRRELDQKIDGVSRHDLLVLAAALHDLGKAHGGADGGRSDHVKRGVEAARPILERFGLTEAQKELVLAVIGHHAPSKLRKPNEPWEEFEKRGGLDLLYEGIEGQGENPYPMETVLHYQADILGRRGDETPAAEVERRKHVTNFLLKRYFREHPEE